MHLVAEGTALEDIREHGQPAVHSDSSLLLARALLAQLSAVAFKADERHNLLAAAIAPIIFGLTVHDDIFIFPDHGKMFLLTDHHRDLIASFSEEDLMNRLRFIWKTPTVRHVLESIRR